MCSKNLKIYLSHNRNKDLSNTWRFRKKCVSASHFKSLFFGVCSWYLPSSLKLLVIKDLQTLPTTGFKEAGRRGSRLQRRRHTETTLRHSIRKMSTQWKWKIIRPLNLILFLLFYSNKRSRKYVSDTEIWFLQVQFNMWPTGLCV